MAKLEQTVSGDFYELLRKIENGIQNSSMSASLEEFSDCLLYTSPSPRDATLSRMPSSA